MVIWLVHYDICHGYLRWDITAIVVSIGKVSDTSGTSKLPRFRLRTFHLFFFSHVWCTRPCTRESLFHWDYWSRSSGSHRKCTVEDRHDAEGKTALSVHANSADVATAGSRLSSTGIHPPAACVRWALAGLHIHAVLSSLLWVDFSALTETGKSKFFEKDDTWSHITKRDNPNVMGTIPWSGWHVPGGWPALLSSVVFSFQPSDSTEGVVCVVCRECFCLSMTTSVHL